MRTISCRHVLAPALLACALALPAIAHAEVTGGTVDADGVGNIISYGSCASMMAVATTPAMIAAAIVYCLRLIAKCIPA